jgi:hypothetical protein
MTHQTTTGARRNSDGYQSTCQCGHIHGDDEGGINER